jgi:hypothetical protein
MAHVSFDMDADDLADLIAFLEGVQSATGGPLLLTLLLTELRRTLASA